MDRPLISIIIVNYNGEKFLKDCFQAIEVQSFKDYEVIIVDNGSHDKSVSFIEENYAHYKLIKKDKNLGFAEGNNLGYKEAKGKWLFCLNNDTVLKEDFFAKIAEAIDRYGDEYSVFAPKILSIHDKATIDSVGGLLIYGDGISRGRGRGETDKGQYNEQEEVLMPSGCAAFYKKDMIDEIGFFDKDFFCYAEDTDLGLRGLVAGYKTLSVPKAVVYHHYSATGGKFSSFKVYLVEKNRFSAAMKNFPLLMVLKMDFYTFYRYIVQIFGVIFNKGTAGSVREEAGFFKMITTLLKSIIAIFRELPMNIRKRKEVKKLKKISDSSIEEKIKKFSISAKDLILKD